MSLEAVVSISYLFLNWVLYAPSSLSVQEARACCFFLWRNATYFEFVGLYFLSFHSVRTNHPTTIRFYSIFFIERWANAQPYQLRVKGATFHFCYVQLEWGGIRYLSYECIRTTSEEFFDAVICAVEKFTFFFLLVLFGFAQCSQRQLPHLLVWRLDTFWLSSIRWRATVF